MSWENADWVNPMPAPQALQIINSVCNDWRTVHPEDKHLPWQKIIFKVLRWRALAGGYSMFICHINGKAISDFRMIDRADLAFPFHG